MGTNSALNAKFTVVGPMGLNEEVDAAKAMAKISPRVNVASLTPKVYRPIAAVSVP